MKTSILDRARRLLGSVMVATALLLFVSGCESAQEVDAATVKVIREAAEQGDVDAQYVLGVSYAYGDGVALDKAEGVKWFLPLSRRGESSGTPRHSLHQKSILD